MRQLTIPLLTCFALTACDKLDTTRTVDSYSSFGEAIYREGCQRVAYTGQLAQKAAGQIATVDVSGKLGHAVCVDQMAPPADAPPKLTTIVQQRGKLIDTVDTMLPKSFLDTLETFLEQLLPLSDDGTMERAIASLGDLLGTMAADPDFSPALARLAIRNGYRPTSTAAGLVHTVVEYPNIDDFIGKTLALIAPGGSAEAEWKQLLTAGSYALRYAKPVDNPGDSQRTLRLALNLLTSTHPDLATGTARPLVTRDYRGLAMANVINNQVAAPFVDKDGDGLADVDAMGHFVDANGQPLAVPTPFPELGASDTAPRDTQGRALVDANSTNTLYRYYDLDGTVFGGLAREGLELMNPNKDTAFGLLWGASALLGPRTTKTQMYMDAAGGLADTLTYNGFDTSQAAVLDLVHAFVQLLGDPNADGTFQSLATLLSQHESEAARLVGAMLDVKDRGKAHPEAQIPATSDLYDDLMPIIDRILAIDGLPKDLLAALEDPRARDFAPMVARLMVARNQIDFDHANGSSYPLTSNLDAIDPVDRTQPDVDYNRSLMQRIAHLIHDANGVKFCNKDGASPLGGIAGSFAKCKMFEIDDLALFYILNMQTDASTSHNPSGSDKSGASFCDHITSTNVLLSPTTCRLGISTLVPIDGFGDFPTPASLNRSLFLRQNEKPQFLKDTTDDVTCSDGDKFIDVHDKSIFAWEAPMVNAPSGNAKATFYTAIQPIVDAFAKHDECVQYDAQMNCVKSQNAAKILVDLFAMLHTHWASPQSSYSGHTYQSTDPTKPRFSYPDNLVSYEPLLAEVLGQSDIVNAVIDATPTLLTMTVDGQASSPKAIDTLIPSAKYIFMPNPNAGVAYRDGSTSTVRSDGVTPVPVVTPYYLMADAFAAKRAALGAAPMPQQTAWNTATSALVDQMLTVQKNPNGTYQFKNRRFRAISILLVNFLRGRLQAHAQAGDLDAWVHQNLTQDITDTLGGPTFAALADFTAKVEADPDARTQLYQLLDYLVDEADHDQVFQTALTTLADQVQMFLDDPDLVPVAHVMGAALDPKKGAVDAQLTLMKKAHDLDTNKALLTILRNLYKQNSDGIYPASDLADILSELNRAQPGHGGPLDGEDYRSILNEVKDFLIDDQRGFTRFLKIVKARGPH